MFINVRCFAWYSGNKYLNNWEIKNDSENSGYSDNRD